MDCFVCTIRGETVAAVASCQHCGAGLCLEHLHEAQVYRVGGTTFGCPHDLMALPANRGLNGRVPRPAKDLRVPVRTAT